MVCDRFSTFSVKCLDRARSARAPSGRLTKKIQRHDRYSLNSPPMTGPRTEAAPQTLAT